MSLGQPAEPIRFEAATDGVPKAIRQAMVARFPQLKLLMKGRPRFVEEHAPQDLDGKGMKNRGKSTPIIDVSWVHWVINPPRPVTRDDLLLEDTGEDSGWADLLQAIYLVSASGDYTDRVDEGHTLEFTVVDQETDIDNTAWIVVVKYNRDIMVDDGCYVHVQMLSVGDRLLHEFRDEQQSSANTLFGVTTDE